MRYLDNSVEPNGSNDDSVVSAEDYLALFTECLHTSAVCLCIVIFPVDMLLVVARRPNENADAIKRR